MKIKYLKLIVFLAVSNLFVVGCSNNDSDIVSAQISTDQALAIVEADDVSEDIGNLIDDYFAFEEGISAKSESVENGGPKFLECMAKTIVIKGTAVSVTLDFGEGCELPNGNVLKGKIILNHMLDMEAKTRTFNFSYEIFYFNDLKVEGTSTMVKVKENENGNPQSTFTFDFKVNWTEGEFLTRNGTKVREWIEGFDTRYWGDNVYLISGN